MKHLFPPVKPGPHVECASPAGLLAVRKSGVNMAIWQRMPEARCEAAVKALLRVPYAVAVDLEPASLPALEAEVGALTAGKCDAQSAHALVADIWSLAGRFCEIADSMHSRLRLERIEDDGCLLFHADTLRLRMLCTYAGPGTEWLENNNARYEELGSRGRTIEETNRAIVIDETNIRHVGPWHVAVFSGRLRTDTPPLIHRSAPVRGETDHRLRLCIDLPDGCAC